jgi:hypothetical protein
VTNRFFISLLLLIGSSLVFGAEECAPQYQLNFSDGNKACMTDYRVFTTPRVGLPEGAIKAVAYVQVGPGFINKRPFFAYAQTKYPDRCLMWSAYAANEFRAVKNCEDGAMATAIKRKINPELCDCEILVDSVLSNNVPMSKATFDDKTRAWVAYVQNDPIRKDTFTAEEREANTKFLAEYKKKLATELASGSNPTQIASTASTIEYEKKLAEEKRLQQELTKKEESIKAQKLADEKRAQQELIQQQKIEAEQKVLAEKLRQEQDLAKKVQIEKEQKVLAEKAKLEQEKKLTETNRIQAELAKVQALEKEKTELVLRMQQEKETREKSLAEAQEALTKVKQTVSKANQASSSQTTRSVKALVIGNSNYGVAALPNPVNDAQAIAKRLTDFGFSVDLVLDGNRKQLISALTKYQKDSSKYEVNMLFYAGHGIQMGGINYIIPTDMSLAPGGGNVEFDAIPVNSIVEKYMQANTKLVFLDACRDNPLSRSLIVASRGSGGASRGLAPIDVGGGTLISFSTKDGNVALDGDGKNSPYTEALLAHINERVDISLMLRKVRKTVMAKTNGKQVPWDYGSLLGDELILSNK